MSCPQSESVANRRSSAPPIKNRRFFVKVFYLSVFCKVVFGEIKSNRRILRFFQAFHHPVLFRALVRRFFAAERTYPFPEAFRLSDVAHKVFRAYFRLAAAFSRFAPPFALRLLPVDTFLRFASPLRPFARLMRLKPETARIPRRSALRATIPSSFLTHGAQTHSMRALSFRHFRTRAVLVWRIEHIRAPPPPRCCVFLLFPYVLSHTRSNLVLFHAHI